MQTFIKIGVLVLEKSEDKTMTLCNFNKDLLISAGGFGSEFFRFIIIEWWVD